MAHSLLSLEGDRNSGQGRSFNCDEPNAPWELAHTAISGVCHFQQSADNANKIILLQFISFLYLYHHFG